VVTIIGVVVDRHLASGTGEGNLSAMQYATKIVQLPLGIIASALGVATLPTLARHALEPGLEQYKAVLSRGLKFALLLILPMTVAVLALNNQILAVVYQHGQYTAQDRHLTAVALYLYAPQLPFAAIDYLLIAAFYALRNTLVPAMLGVVGVCIYLAVALSLVGRLGFPALVLANTLQNSLHGIILFVLLRRQLGSLRGYTLAQSALKLTVAGLAMAVVAVGFTAGLDHVAALSGLTGQLLQLAIAGGAGLAVYVGVVTAMGVDEMRLARTMLQSRLPGQRTPILPSASGGERPV